jgi:hypothetical protein
MLPSKLLKELPLENDLESSSSSVEVGIEWTLLMSDALPDSTLRSSSSSVSEGDIDWTLLVTDLTPDSMLLSSSSPSSSVEGGPE